MPGMHACARCCAILVQPARTTGNKLGAISMAAPNVLVDASALLARRPLRLIVLAYCTCTSRTPIHESCMGLGQRLGATAHKKACRLAAGRGSLDVLKLFREQGCPWDKFTCALALPRPLPLRFCASSKSAAQNWFVHFHVKIHRPAATPLLQPTTTTGTPLSCIPGLCALHAALAPAPSRPRLRWQRAAEAPKPQSAEPALRAHPAGTQHLRDTLSSEVRERLLSGALPCSLRVRAARAPGRHPAPSCSAR